MGFILWTSWLIVTMTCTLKSSHADVHQNSYDMFKKHHSLRTATTRPVLTNIKPASGNYFFNYDDDGNNPTMRDILVRQNLHKNLPPRGKYHHTFNEPINGNQHHSPAVIKYQKSHSLQPYPMLDLGYVSNAYAHAPEIEASPQALYENNPYTSSQSQPSDFNPQNYNYPIPPPNRPHPHPPAYFVNDNSLTYDFPSVSNAHGSYGTKKPGNYGSSGWIPINPYKKKSLISHNPNIFNSHSYSSTPFHYSSPKQVSHSHSHPIEHHPHIVSNSPVDVIPSLSYDFSYKTPQHNAPGVTPAVQKYYYYEPDNGLSYNSASSPKVSALPSYQVRKHFSIKDGLVRPPQYNSYSNRRRNERSNSNYDGQFIKQPKKYYTPKLDTEVVKFKSSIGHEMTPVSAKTNKFPHHEVEKHSSIAVQVPYHGGSTSYSHEYIVPSNLDYDIEETTIIPRIRGYFKRENLPPAQAVDYSTTEGTALNPIRILAKNAQPSVSHYHGSRQ